MRHRRTPFIGPRVAALTYGVSRSKVEAAITRGDLAIVPGTRSLLRLRDVERWLSVLSLGIGRRRSGRPTSDGTGEHPKP